MLNLGLEMTLLFIILPLNFLHESYIRLKNYCKADHPVGARVLQSPRRHKPHNSFLNLVHQI